MSCISVNRYSLAYVFCVRYGRLRAPTGGGKGARKMKTWQHFGVAASALTLGLMTPALAMAAGPAAPTFTKDIAPIFQDKCEACHRPDSIAPMSLVTYEETRPWARSIRTR